MCLCAANVMLREFAKNVSKAMFWNVIELNVLNVTLKSVQILQYHRSDQT